MRRMQKTPVKCKDETLEIKEAEAGPQRALSRVVRLRVGSRASFEEIEQATLEVANCLRGNCLDHGQERRLIAESGRRTQVNLCRDVEKYNDVVKTRAVREFWDQSVKHLVIGHAARHDCSRACSRLVGMSIAAIVALAEYDVSLINNVAALQKHGGRNAIRPMQSHAPCNS